MRNAILLCILVLCACASSGDKIDVATGVLEVDLFSLPEDEDYMYYPLLLKEHRKAGIVDAVTSFIETPHMLLFGYNIIGLGYLDKREGKLHIMKHTIPFVTLSGNILYSSLPKEHLKLVNEKDFFYLDEAQKKLVSELPDGTHILVYYKLK